VGLACLVSACAPGLPRVSGVPATAPEPSARWTPPARTAADSAAIAADPLATLHPDAAAYLRTLTLVQAIDVALSGNPSTRIAWANARAAAASYGSARGSWFPTIDLDATVTRLKTVATQGRSAVQQTVYGPGVNLTYLLFDFGGRTGSVEAARQALLAADFAHNATLQDVVLQVEQAYFTFLATKALREARSATLEEAQTSLDVAEERHKVGLATIADVLQSRTAFSQARLDAEEAEGQVLIARGALALALGLPAHVPLDADSAAARIPLGPAADSVEVLIARAVRERPDLEAARAQVRQSQALIDVARAQRLPALLLNGTAERSYSSRIPNGDYSYNVSLALQIPLFSGFSREYDQRRAEAEAEAVAAGAEGLEQRVIFQVFSAYYALQTATRRTRTADDLLASAQQSNDVALGRYRAGVGTILDLLAAQNALASARADRVQARLAWVLSLAQLAHDAGVLDLQGASDLRVKPDSTSVEEP
jgi:TolC family type I secretion outer membrane protein